MTRCYYCSNEITDKNYLYVKDFSFSHRRQRLHKGKCITDYLWYGWPKRILVKNGVLE